MGGCVSARPDHGFFRLFQLAQDDGSAREAGAGRERFLFKDGHAAQFALLIDALPVRPTRVGSFARVYSPEWFGSIGV